MKSIILNNTASNSDIFFIEDKDFDKTKSFYMGDYDKLLDLSVFAFEIRDDDVKIIKNKKFK